MYVNTITTWHSVQLVFPIACPPLTESPFARRRHYLLQGGVSTAWTGVTPPSSLVLAHAQGRMPPIDYGLGLVRWVFAGCWEPLLADGPSRRYLHDLCMGAWTPTPPRSPGAPTRFFPGDIGLTLGITRSAREKSLQCDFNRGCLSRLQSFANVQAPMLARPPDRTHRRGLPRGSRAVYTTQWTWGHPQELWHRYVSDSGN